MCKNRWCLAFLLGFFLLGSCFLPAAEAGEDLQLIIENRLYSSEDNPAQPQLLGDRVYVPLRLVSEALGYSVQWKEATREIFITEVGVEQNPTAAEKMGQGKDSSQITIWVRDALLSMDTSTGQPFITDAGYTMIPLRVVGEALHCVVQWQDGVVLVSLPQKQEETAATEDNNASEDSSKTEETVQVRPYDTLSIVGKSTATESQMNAYLARKESDVRALLAKNYPGREFIPFPDNIVELYLSIGEKYNIRGDVAFAQAMKETGYFQFYGSVQAFQNNFCGLNAIGTPNTGEELLNGVDESRGWFVPGLHGISYQTVEDGVEAHIQHLYAYATKEDLPDGCELLDPRFSYVKRGIASRWSDLNGRWAVPGNGYGESILYDYWEPMLQES